MNVVTRVNMSHEINSIKFFNKNAYKMPLNYVIYVNTLHEL